MSGRFKVTSLNRIGEYWGPSQEFFLVQLHCELAEEGAAGGEALQVTVVSPAQLSLEIGEGEIEVGRGYLIACEYDEPRLKARLQKLVDSCRAESWMELMTRMQRYFDAV